MKSVFTRHKKTGPETGPVFKAYAIITVLFLSGWLNYPTLPKNGIE